MPEKLPPGPSGPRLAQAARWMLKPTEFMAAAQEQYGDVWRLKLVGDRDQFCVTDPKLIDEVFKAGPELMHGGESNITATAVLGATSVLVLDGDEHTEQRNLLRLPFQGDGMEQYSELMSSICNEEIDSWPLNEPFELLPRMESITLEMIMHVIFGVREAARQDLLRRRIDDLLEWGAGKLVMPRLKLTVARGKPPPKSFLAAREPLDELLFEEIDLARRDPRLDERDDALAILIRARHEDGSPMTDTELRDALMTLLLQGHSSTGAALSWALERLMRHPDVFDRFRAEAQADNDEYLDAVITETMRVRPPVTQVSRHPQAPFRLGQYEAPPGSPIGILIWQVHRRPELYHDPERFHPERMLEQPAKSPGWCPFGGGDRHCIGRTFATTEMRAVLKTIARRTRLEPVDIADEKPSRRRVVFVPGKGARATLRERIPA